ncbi:MAG: hypothetical protein ABI777_05455 [Betaproteobacteria bacterium]
MQPSDHEWQQSKMYRTVTGAFGTFFVILAVAIIAISEMAPGVAIAAFLLGVLGIDAIVAALRGKKSLLSRIGPLP